MSDLFLGKWGALLKWADFVRKFHGILLVKNDENSPGWNNPVMQKHFDIVYKNFMGRSVAEEIQEKKERRRTAFLEVAGKLPNDVIDSLILPMAKEPVAPEYRRAWFRLFCRCNGNEYGLLTKGSNRVAMVVAEHDIGQEDKNKRSKWGFVKRACEKWVNSGRPQRGRSRDYFSMTVAYYLALLLADVILFMGKDATRRLLYRGNKQVPSYWLDDNQANEAIEHILHLDQDQEENKEYVPSNEEKETEAADLRAHGQAVLQKARQRRLNAGRKRRKKRR